jgi:single-stranded-DNA-specific exonuclease
MMQMQWEILQPDPQRVKAIARHLKCSSITATVLANRDIRTPEQARAFLYPALDSLPDPMQLGGMDIAVDRICRAVEAGEKIMVFGDYDADGVTAATVLTRFLAAAGADIQPHIPHRIHEGYGLQVSHISQLAVPSGANLVITVDCGSSSHEAVSAARRRGIDVVITDHHEIPTPPEALAVINPKAAGQPEAFNCLAGVGVAFYLTIGLRTELRRRGWWARRKEPNLIELCDLVAIGTIADLVPLTGINRVLTKAGLGQFCRSDNPGVTALCRAAGVDPCRISSETVAYRLAPRINAAGRISHASTAFNLLNASEPGEAGELAETLDQLNQRRQAFERDIFDRIVRQIDGRQDLLARNALLLADNRWHPGVLGIVASKLVDRYNRPVILISTQNGIGKGSGRSIEGIDLFAAISTCSDLLDAFGGHRLAAGLTVSPDRIRALQSRFEASVGSLMNRATGKKPLAVDSEIRFSQIDGRLMQELETLEPFGTDNPPPVFAAADVRVTSAAIVGQRHRKMTLRQDGGGDPIEAIHFNLSPDTPRAENFERLAFRLQWNHYRGDKHIQMVVEDF